MRHRPGTGLRAPGARVMRWVENVPGCPILLAEEPEGHSTITAPSASPGTGLPTASLNHLHAQSLRHPPGWPSVFNPIPSRDWPDSCASSPTIDRHLRPARAVAASGSFHFNQLCVSPGIINCTGTGQSIPQDSRRARREARWGLRARAGGRDGRELGGGTVSKPEGVDGPRPSGRHF